MIKSSIVTVKKIVLSVLITCLVCSILSVIIFKGQYFQNWLNSDCATYKPIVLVYWFLFFAYSGICLLCLLQSNSKETNYLFFFATQFLAFAIYLISVYYFSTYILATVSSVISVIFSIRLIITLFKNQQYFTMSLMLVMLFVHLHCVFRGIVYCSMEYGFWKE